ncbi:MAG: helix-turn-helix transcriptional regulator [bacterium]|nr:helix-turn-helix transcriptional regulator [bacterium]
MNAIRQILIIFPLCMFSLSCANQSSPIQFHDFLILQSPESSLSIVQQGKDWKPINSLLFIDLPYAAPKGFRHAWIKASFTVNDTLKYSGLFLDTRDLIDSTYINSTLVGRKNIPNITAIEYFKPGLYRIPAGTLKKGSNSLYIRISLLGNFKGSIRNLELLSDSGLKSKNFRNELLYEQIFIILIIMYSLLFIVQITMYLVDRKIKIRLLNSLLILYIITLLLLLFFSPIIIKHINYFITFYLTSLSVLILYLAILLQSLYRIYLSNFNRIFTILNILGAALICLSNGHLLIQLFLFVVIVAGGFGSLGYLLYKLNRIRPRKFLLRVIIVKFILICISNIWQGLSIPLELTIQCPDYLTYYLGIVYIFIAILYEAIEARRQRQSLNKLYNRLKEKKPQKNPRPAPTISGTSEEKLDTVIAFIEENYKSDLSREGLAAAVDINPNYLSTLFNAYTGKKINDYINGLRIKDAIQQLGSSEKKIIDVAFDSGFESLSTFIRAFRNETGKTPSQYREKIKASL